MNKEGPANILASKDSLLSFGDNLIILSIPQNNKKTKVEPIINANTTSKFLEIISVNSLKRMA